MSENDVEKMTKEVLGDSKSATAKALVIVAMSMDNMTSAIIENQKKVDDRIVKLECKTDKRFEELRFWAFISNNRWISILLIVSLIIVIIWSVKAGDPTTVIKTFK